MVRQRYLLAGACWTLCLAGLAACGGASPKKDAGPAPTPAEYEAVKGRAKAAHDNKAPSLEPAPVPLSPAPEFTPPQAKIGVKDSAGCTWVEAEAKIIVSKDQTANQAEAAAISEARILAMQDFLGVSVKSRFMDFHQEGLRNENRLTENILQTTRDGHILKEEILEKGWRDMSECQHCRYFVKLKTCLLQDPPGSDKDFQVELKISQPNFKEGDEAVISVTATKDCFLYLYNVNIENWETSLLVPNDQVPQAKLSGGQAWEYPDSEAKKHGVRLIAQLPESNPSMSAETIRVVASKVPLPRSTTDPAHGFLAIMRRLNSTKSAWAEDSEAFTISKKPD